MASVRGIFGCKKVAVLGYHKVGPPPEDWWSWQYVPGEVFAAQIALLREDGWVPVSADELVRGLESPDALRERSFLVTFDDAYMSLRGEAVARLRDLGAPAIVFTPTDFVGDWNRFDDGTEPREEICDWDTLRELEQNGISVQSHGVTHRSFSTLSRAELTEEAVASRRLLQENLGSPVNLLAYPYGDAGNGTECADVLREAGYRAAFGYGGGAFSVPTEDVYVLPRLAMGPDTDVRAELSAVA